MGVVKELVDGGGRQRLGHDFVESGWVQVRGDGECPFLVGSVDEPVKTFGGVKADGE